MKWPIALLTSLMIGYFAGSTGRASAAVDCQYVGYPAGCVVRSGAPIRPTRDARRIPPSIDARPSGFIWQDLFDRNNPNNLQADWPSPPVQPGQL